MSEEPDVVYRCTGKVPFKPGAKRLVKCNATSTADTPCTFCGSPMEKVKVKKEIKQ